MTPEQEKKLDQVHAAVIQLNIAVIGNNMGTPGIIPRLDSLEDYKKKDVKFKAKAAGWIAGALFVGCPLVTIIVQLLVEYFK